jgi:aminopeptidase N
MSHEDYLLDARLTCRAYGEQEAAADGLFPLPGDKPRYARDRVADIKHVRLDVQLDLDAKRITGRVSHTFTPLNDGLTAFDLDAVDLEIAGVASGIGAEQHEAIATRRQLQIVPNVNGRNDDAELLGNLPP